MFVPHIRTRVNPFVFVRLSFYLPLKLPQPIPPSDERIIEYDVDKVLFEKESPFQKVQIVHTKSVGNMLVLDELQSELDTS